MNSCNTESTKVPEQKKYLRWVGDIAYDASIDKSDFSICNGEDKIVQYFNDGNGLEYEGEKIAIEKVFAKEYRLEKPIQETGLIRIRFIVNCQGESGRFRVLGMNSLYEEKNFAPLIVNELLRITKSLKGWKIKSMQNQTIDYYQYLIFKMENGKLIEILP